VLILGLTFFYFDFVVLLLVFFILCKGLGIFMFAMFFARLLFFRMTSIMSLIAHIKCIN